MPAFLSQEWLDERSARCGSLPEREGASACVERVIGGGPNGEVRYMEHILDGQVQKATLGGADDADISLTQPYDVAIEIARGEIDEPATFMQGRTKVVGSMGFVMALMPVWASDDYRAALAEVNRATEY